MPFILKESTNGAKYYAIDEFDKTNMVKTCFTTKMGGVSNGEFSTLNMGTKTNDKRENIIKNYEIICEALGIRMENLVLSDQVHKDEIKIVHMEDKGKGILCESDIKEIDGLITSQKDICLVTQYADCVPVYIFDKKNKVISLVHSGWRGTVKKISKKAIEIMKDVYNTNPSDCIGAIGPSIGVCCYEVDERVIEEFKKHFNNVEDFVKNKKNGKYNLDLWEANKSILKDTGLNEENIIVSHVCTMCNEELFSYRRDNGNTGRMAAMMQLL
ncbi:peptidoglycan editing factor PgeF [Anaeromicrobium sediminis]|uniref:Purine nucleoside phosphorylase n=1 Tax=Anaeromicrobium sediminis TaxID=1478221 RepID=A0A267MJ73_9FIRM|nr:peptidoglycan editing factor PgeF [Anaeromicrobium sediminis]PAB58840.1 polyphenol oxidase [Anaeromicrobium sediminis]